MKTVLIFTLMLSMSDYQKVHTAYTSLLIIYMCAYVSSVRRHCEIIPDHHSGCFGPARATRCQAGCNIEQRALTMTGRTPATKATTKRFSLTAFPLSSASYMTPAPAWKKISAPLLRTRRRSLESAQKRLLQIEHRQAEIEGGVMEGTVHLPVNLAGVFLS